MFTDEESATETATAALTRQGLLVAPAVVQRETAIAARKEVLVALGHTLHLPLHETVDLLGEIREPLFRHDIKLELVPAIARLLIELRTSILGTVLSASIGADAALCELSCIVSARGAPPQPAHADTPAREEDAETAHHRALARHGSRLFTAFVALGDVAPTMGPTVMWPGTHTPGFQSALRERGKGTLHSSLAVHMDLSCGDCVLMDSRLWHAGGANVDRADRLRCLLVASFVAPAHFPEGDTYSLLPHLVGRLSLLNMQPLLAALLHHEEATHGGANRAVPEEGAAEAAEETVSKNGSERQQVLNALMARPYGQRQRCGAAGNDAAGSVSATAGETSAGICGTSAGICGTSTGSSTASLVDAVDNGSEASSGSVALLPVRVVQRLLQLAHALPPCEPRAAQCLVALQHALTPEVEKVQIWVRVRVSVAKVDSATVMVKAAVELGAARVAEEVVGSEAARDEAGEVIVGAGGVHKQAEEREGGAVHNQAEEREGGQREVALSVAVLRALMAFCLFAPSHLTGRRSTEARTNGSSETGIAELKGVREAVLAALRRHEVEGAQTRCSREELRARWAAAHRAFATRPDSPI